MHTLASLLPDLAADLERRLRDRGYERAASDAPGSLVAQVTWDAVANAGYIYLHPLRERVAASLVLDTEPFSIVQFDAMGKLFGIEFLSPPQDFADKLRRLAAL